MNTFSDLKSIEYSREDHDFVASFDGNPIGVFTSYSAAEAALDQHVFDLLEAGLIGDVEVVA